MIQYWYSKDLTSTQYKKLAPNTLLFTYWNLKSCKSQRKNKTKNIRLLVFSFSSINLAFWCYCFVFSCGLQDFKFEYVNCKAFGASFLYWVDFSKIQMRLDTSFFLIVLAFASFEIASHFFAGMINISIDRKKGDNLLLIQGPLQCTSSQ